MKTILIAFVMNVASIFIFAVSDAYGAKLHLYLRGGRLSATWHEGISPREDQKNYVVVATSGDRGETWE